MLPFPSNSYLDAGRFCVNDLGLDVVAAQEKDSITVGFADTVRIGHWNAITIELEPDQRDATRFEIDCLDGSGTRVTYEGELSRSEDNPNVGQGWFRAGRATSQLAVRLLSGDDSVLLETTLQEGDNFQYSSPTLKNILLIESDEKLMQASETAIKNAGGDRQAISIHSARELPYNRLGYEGVDQIYFSASDAELTSEINKKQYATLLDWVENGGHLILNFGIANADAFRSDGPLARFLPGKYVDTEQVDSASRLQFFTNSQTDILERGETLGLATIENDGAVATLSQDGKPLILEEARGFGSIKLITFDIETESVYQWNGLGTLVRKLFFGVSDIVANESKGGRVAHHGYEDLVGQLRVPLDQFSSVRFVTFTWVAVLIALYILCIGPGDFFLLKKVFRKMELTWVTFGLITAGFCALAWYGTQFTKPSEIQINQLEIIDMDAVTGKARGTVWTNLYSPATDIHDVSLSGNNAMDFQIGGAGTVWQGLPGDGLGGMESSANTNLAVDEYRIKVDTSEKDPKTKLVGFPLRVSSSKSVVTRWSGKNFGSPNSNLRYSDRIQQLEGAFTNPLDRELKNVRLLFEDWVYVVNVKVGPGDTIDVLTETVEKNARNYFTRRAAENKGASVAWDPTDTDLSRISDMLMFYENAGGEGYVGLSHNYQNYLDLTPVLNLDRAILVGEIESNTTEIMLDDESGVENYDRSLTVLRVVLPVQRNKKK